MKDQLANIIRGILNETPDADYTYGDMRLRVEHRIPGPLSDAVHDALDTDTELLKLMTSRDPNLPSFRHHVTRFLEHNLGENTKRIVVWDLINFARWYDIHDAYPYEAQVDGQAFTFPGKHVFAYWKSIEDLLE